MRCGDLWHNDRSICNDELLGMRRRSVLDNYRKYGLLRLRCRDLWYCDRRISSNKLFGMRGGSVLGDDGECCLHGL